MASASFRARPSSRLRRVPAPLRVGDCSWKGPKLIFVSIGFALAFAGLLGLVQCSCAQGGQQVTMTLGLVQPARFAQLPLPHRPWQHRPARPRSMPWQFGHTLRAGLRQTARNSAQPGVSEARQPEETSNLQGPLDVEVAVAGGGLGGLAVCAALRARGIDAHVFEAAPQLLRGSTGTGIMISANGWEALEAVDAAIPSLMRAQGARITRQSIRLTDAMGTVTRTFSMNATTYKDRYGAEQYNVGWARAHEILASIVPDEAVHTGHRLAAYLFDNNSETLDISFDNGRHVHAPLLVGADGVGSVVRRLVAGDVACATRYNGQLLWNAMLDSKLVPQAHENGEVEFIQCGVDGQAILAFDAGQGKTSWYLTLMEKTAPPGVKAALASGAFGGFGRAGVIEELKKAFAPWPLAIELLEATPETQIFERRLADRAALQEWADKSTKGGGRVVLVGDAAHPMIPSQGQGTMLTWEDAADLAALLEQKSKAHGLRQGVPAAVSDFVARRAKRCAEVQRYSGESYMGKPMPSFPVLMWRLLLMKVRGLFGFKSMQDKMYGGYTALRVDR